MPIVVAAGLLLSALFGTTAILIDDRAATLTTGATAEPPANSTGPGGPGQRTPASSGSGQTQVLETRPVTDRVPARDALLLFGVVLMLLGVIVLRHEALARWGPRHDDDSAGSGYLVDLRQLLFGQRPAGS